MVFSIMLVPLGVGGAFYLFPLITCGVCLVFLYEEVTTMFTRNFQFCKPDCSERRPGCQDHCEFHAERKKLFVELKAKADKGREADCYALERKIKNRSFAAKKKRGFAGSSWRRCMK